MDYATTNGTALAGSDYVATNGTLAFAAGETEQTLAVRILNDGTLENPEVFQINLSNPGGHAGLGGTNSVTVTITDNDKGLQLDAASYTVSEEVGSVELGILRNDDGDYPLTVDVRTLDGTAIAGVDYVGVTNTVQFAARELLKLVPVPILNDTVWESSKEFRVTLSNPTGGGQLGSPVLRGAVPRRARRRVQLGTGHSFTEVNVHSEPPVAEWTTSSSAACTPAVAVARSNLHLRPPGFDVARPPGEPHGGLLHLTGLRELERPEIREALCELLERH